MRMKARVNLSLDSDTLNRSKDIGINLSQFLQYSLDHALRKLEAPGVGFEPTSPRRGHRLSRLTLPSKGSAHYCVPERSTLPTIIECIPASLPGALCFKSISINR